MLLWMLPAAFACAEVTPVDDLVVALADAERAWAALDDDAPLVLDRVALLLPCVAEPLSTEQAARVHRVQGLRLWASQRALAEQALAAARATDPDFAWHDAVLAPEHSARQHYEAANPSGPTVRVPAPRDGALWFDGAPGRLRPTARATLFQHDGSTAWVPAGERLPAYAERPPPTVPLALAAGGFAVGSGLTYALAWSARSQADRLAAEGDRAGAEAAVGRTQALAASSVGALGATAVAAGLAWWVQRR